MPKSTELFDEQLRSSLTKEMNAVSLSTDRKDHLHATLTRAIQSDKAASASSRAAFHTRRVVKRAVAATLGAGLIAGGGFAYANGSLVPVTDFVADVFGAGPADTEIVNKVGRPIGASVSDNGITMSADAIIGDKYNYSIVYSIRKDDGTDFENLPAANSTSDPKSPQPLPLGFKKHETFIRGAQGSAGSAYFYDADPADPSIQLVEQLSVFDDSDLNGKTAHAKFTDLFSFADDGEPENQSIIASGDWKLSFKFNYEDASRELSPQDHLHVPAGATNSEKLTVSPIALTLTYAIDKPLPQSKTPSGQEPEHSSIEEFRDAGKATVFLKNGEKILLEFGASSLEQDNNETKATLSAFLPRIVDVDDISVVRIGETEFN